MTNPPPRPALQVRVKPIHCAGPCQQVTDHLFRIDFLAGQDHHGRAWICRDCRTRYQPHLIPPGALRHDADDPKETT